MRVTQLTTHRQPSPEPAARTIVLAYNDVGELAGFADYFDWEQGFEDTDFPFTTYDNDLVIQIYVYTRENVEPNRPADFGLVAELAVPKLPLWPGGRSEDDAMPWIDVYPGEHERPEAEDEPPPVWRRLMQNTNPVFPQGQQQAGLEYTVLLFSPAISVIMQHRWPR